LIILIRQVVGTPKDWGRLSAFDRQGLPGKPGQPEEDEDANVEANNLGFYPPAMALVVKGTSRIHTRNQSPLSAPGALPPGGMGALDKDRDGFARIGPRKDREKDPVGDPKDDPKLVKDDKKKPPKDETPLAELDPKVIWQDALTKGVDDHGLIIAVADFLAKAQKFEHVAEFLKADLRQGIVVRPWVYEALAQALRETNASPEEIERAELSSIDLEPLDAGGYLKASRAMAENKQFDHAIAFCRHSAALEPNIPQPYELALSHAFLAKDPEAMEWAAGHILFQDWPLNNQELHDKARVKLDGLAKSLTADGRTDDVERMLAAVKKQQQRDLIVRANWQGVADRDLKIKGPTASTLSCLDRQTVDGGILIGDNLSETNSETGIYAQAFTGDYDVWVDRVWGNTLEDKVQLEIIQHQGTPKEHHQLVTVKTGEVVKVKVEDGRRKTLAQVPPPATVRRAEQAASPGGVGAVLVRLRALADNDPLLGPTTDVNGGVGVNGGSETWKDSSAERSPAERVAFQTRVSPFVNNNIDLTAQATISADRRYVRLSLSPVFNTVTGFRTTPVINNPLLPGGPAGQLP
jgi:hypothetical protein